ncbi:hypothetical protein Q7P35_011848 [Cladosporium inversicolor]
MFGLRCLRSAFAPAASSLQPALPQLARQTLAPIQAARPLSILSQLPSRPTATPSLATHAIAADVPTASFQLPSQPGLALLQVRGAKRDTYDPSHRVRKRRHEEKAEGTQHFEPLDGRFNIGCKEPREGINSQIKLKTALELGEYNLVQEMNYQPAIAEYSCLPLPHSTTNIDLALRLDGLLIDAKYVKIRKLAAGNPATDSSNSPKDGSCPWNLLPRELRDEALRHTYGRHSNGLKIIFKTEIDMYNKWDNSTWLGGGDSRRPVHFEHYINRFLVCKEWASEAAQAMFSTTEIRFDSHVSKSFLTQTCLGMADINTINLEMRDLVRFAGQLANLPSYALACADFASAPRTLSSGSRWFQAIRPLSGLEDASVNFMKIPFVEDYIYNVYEQDNIRTNTALVRSVLKQSATRPREAASSGTLTLPDHGLRNSASKRGR